MNKLWKEKGKIIANIGTKAQTTDHRYARGTVQS